MKKRKRCNLCGAKLTGDICQECGYNNAAYHYKINTSDDYCSHSSSETFYEKEDHEAHMDPKIDLSYDDGRKKTGADAGEEQETETGTESWDYSQVLEQYDDDFEEKYVSVPNETPVTYGLNEKRTRKKSGKGSGLAKAVTVLCVAAAAGGFLLELADEYGVDILRSIERFLPEEDMEDQEAYNGLSVQTPGKADDSAGAESPSSEAEPLVHATGKEYEEELSPGFYVVGIHIPAGAYRASWVSGSGAVYFRDIGNRFWESEYMYEEKETDLLQLEAGTVVNVTDTLVLVMKTDESQGYLETEECSEHEVIELADLLVVGEDIPAGTYHVTAQNIPEYGGSIWHRFSEGDDWEDTNELYFYEDVSDYQNLILEDGDILVSVNCEAVLETAQYDISGYQSNYY